MEAEHEAIDPLIDAINAALADRESGPQRLGDLTDALAAGLTGHLKQKALPLIQAIVTEQQWQHFGQVNARLVGPDAPRILPGCWTARASRPSRRCWPRCPNRHAWPIGTSGSPRTPAVDLWGAGTPG